MYFFFFDVTATTQIYTLSLHDALPICLISTELVSVWGIFLLRQFFLTIPRELEDAARLDGAGEWTIFWRVALPDRKSTRLNSSHSSISYAVFCLKKKKTTLPFITMSGF